MKTDPENSEEKKEDLPHKKTLLEMIDGDECKIYAYQRFITRKLEKRERVPLYVFNRLIQAIVDQNKNDVEEIIKKVSEEAVQKTLKRFSHSKYQFKGYKFEYSLPEPIWGSKTPDYKQKKRIRTEYNLEKMVRYVFKEITQNINLDKKWTADICVQQTAIAITKYADEYFTIEKHKFFKQYKRGALATFITLQFGFEFPYITFRLDKPFTNHDLFQSTRYAIDHVIDYSPIPPVLKIENPQPKKD